MVMPGDSNKARLFISYKRGVSPDEPLALELYEVLRKRHQVFIDQRGILVGADWARRIEEELRQADFLITLLSAESVGSAMVLGEVEKAREIGLERHGKPAILPVRVAFRQPFGYPLSAYLNPINWAYWSGADDTPRLLEELERSIGGGELGIVGDQCKAELVEPPQPDGVPAPTVSAQPAALEMPEGTIDPESQFYISRPSDGVAQRAFDRGGVTVTIKGSRQMGKSSLLIRTLKQARAAGRQVAFLDFQLLTRDTLRDADQFFVQFCAWITEELGVEDRVEQYWKSPLGRTQRATRYLGRHVLPAAGAPVVLAMDEVDSILDTDFRTDFFGMLRSWHNNRAKDPAWNRLDLALVISTEPYQLIENLNQSPFNVGEVIELADFQPEHVTELNRRHGNPLTESEVDRLIALVGAHPYLVRRALYLVADKRYSGASLFASAHDDHGPFGDHLRYHLFRLQEQPAQVRALLQIIDRNSCADENLFNRLRGAGLVRREGQRVVPRCRLYAQFFKERLDVRA
jgi:hypothetical protein